MPREVIRDEASLFDIAVIWSGEKSYVQVGTQTHDGRPIARALGWPGANQSYSSEGRHPDIPEPADVSANLREREVIELSPDESANGVPEREPAQFTALWGTLDRAGVNHLIRVLRRARNAAYGADE